MGAPEWVDVLPIKNGDFPEIAMSVYQRLRSMNRRRSLSRAHWLLPLVANSRMLRIYTSLIENISIARLQDVLRIISYNVQTMFRKWNDLTAEYTCCRTISCKTSHMFSLISLSHLTVWFEMCFSKPTKNMCQNALLKLLVKIPRQLNHIFFAIWAWHHDSYMTGTFVASIVSIPS